MFFKKIAFTSFTVFYLLAAFPGAGALPARAEEASSHSHQKVKKYTCVMHPQIIRDEPGDCPICGMRLVEIMIDPDTQGVGAMPSHVAVHIDAEKQQLIGVVTEPAQKRALKKTFHAPARVAQDPDLYQAQIDYLREARAATGSLRNKDLDYRNLYVSHWEAPRVDQARAKVLQMGMDETALDELVKSGKADERLLQHSADGEVWLYAEVYDRDAQRIRRGDHVRVEVPSLPGKTLEATVNGISFVADPVTHTVRVWCLVKDPDNILRPGVWVSVEICTDLGKAISVPESAIVFAGDKTLVFVETGPGHFEPREVTLGQNADGFYMIVSGLGEKETVVTSGNFLVDSESRLKAAVGASAQEHSHGSSK